MTQSKAPKRIAVIGGGMTGLAAAHELVTNGNNVKVTVFESGDRAGGVIQTVRQDGFLIEGAADNFITTSPVAVKLCHQLGLGDQLVGTTPGREGAMVMRRGKLEPIPAGFTVMAPSRIWPILASKILSPWGKLRSGVEYFLPRRRDVEDESLQAFVCRRFGREMFDRLVQPLVGGIYTADPNRLSVAATMPRFMEMEKQYGSLIRGMLRERKARPKATANSRGARYSMFMTLNGGMSRLVDALVSSLPEGALRLNSPVTDIVRDGMHWSLQVDAGKQPWEQFDSVIVAAPAGPASQLLSKVDVDAADEIAEIPYASCAVVSLAYKLDQVGEPLNSYGFVVPIAEDHFILSCSFSSLKYPGRAPEDSVLMRVFIGGACQSGLLRMPDSELMELAHWELCKTLRISGDPLMRHIKRQVHAMPQYHVGHNQRVQKIRDRLAAFPTLTVAGSAYGGVGVPSCIESGKRAAQQILAATEAPTDVWELRDSSVSQPDENNGNELGDETMGDETKRELIEH
ncbi:protoporphyrinogen oxidase [Crateriforma spongiae]|uniref:protoporphyrinogen oxidase n=1 Tax=Crateriforma spongiae TaxID=2724528 RepID=UPI0039B0A195